MLGTQCVIEDALVVGVCSLLGVPGGNRPTMHNTFHDFHGEVGAFNQTNLDGRTAVSNALRCPCLQPLHCGESIGQVCLKHDACFKILQMRLIQDLGKDLNGHIEVFVLFHVQVNELLGGRGCGQLIQRSQTSNCFFDNFVKCPVLMRTRDSRYLNRNIINVVTSEQTLSLRETMLGFIITQHCLTQQVNVQTVTTLGKFCDGISQFLFGSIDDQVTYHFAQYATRHRNGRPRHLTGQLAAEANGGLHVPRQEGRS